MRRLVPPHGSRRGVTIRSLTGWQAGGVPTTPAPHVAVVGAGISGLAAALAVRRHGPPGTRITVLEASAQVGGKLRTSEIEGVPVDEGAEAFLVRRPEALALAHQVGLGEDLVAPATLAASVWSHGKLHPLPKGTVLGVPTSARSLRGLLPTARIARASLDLVLPRIDVGDDVAVGSYVAARLGRGVVDRLVDPLLGGVYAGRADDLSLAATVPDLARTARRRRSLLAAAREAQPPSAPGPVFHTLRGGLVRLAAAVAAASGATVRTSCTVRDLARTATGWRLTLDSAHAPELLDADAVIVAVPAPAARRLLAAAVPAAATELGAIDYASVAIVTLAYRAQLPRVGSGFLVPAVEGRLVKAATFASAKWPHLAGNGLAVVRCSIGRYGETGDLQRDDGELVAGSIANLAEMACLSNTPVAARVTRWGGALPQYAVGHLDRVARVHAAVELQPGLAVCGAAYDGVGVPACIASGQRAGRAVAEALSPR